MNEWLNIALECTKTVNIPEIRKSVFEGLKYLLRNPKTHSNVKEILPKFLDSFYDTDVDVKLSVLDLFLEVENCTNIHVSNIVPLKLIIDCLEVS